MDFSLCSYPIEREKRLCMHAQATVQPESRMTMASIEDVGSAPSGREATSRESLMRQRAKGIENRPVYGVLHSKQFTVTKPRHAANFHQSRA